jgi:protein SCO1/2
LIVRRLAFGNFLVSLVAAMFRFSRTFAVALVSALALAGCDSRERALSGLRGVTLTPAQPKQDFELTDTHGAPFHFVADTRGAATLVYFGYTNCPDVCPVQLSNIAAALKRLPADVQSSVRVVFITTDPARDTPERLRAWLDNFDPRFIGLRGSLDSVNAIARVVGVPAATIEPMDAMAPGPHAAYGVGHAAQVLAFSADDSLRAEYPSGFTVDDWVNDLPKLVRIR